MFILRGLTYTILLELFAYGTYETLAYNLSKDNPEFWYTKNNNVLKRKESKKTAKKLFVLLCIPLIGKIIFISITSLMILSSILAFSKKFRKEIININSYEKEFLASPQEYLKKIYESKRLLKKSKLNIDEVEVENITTRNIRRTENNTMNLVLLAPFKEKLQTPFKLYRDTNGNEIVSIEEKKNRKIEVVYEKQPFIGNRNPKIKTKTYKMR